MISFPPNYLKIKAGMDIAGRKPIFCYGNIIHNPHKLVITPSLNAHEESHSVRQLSMGVEEWWDRYIADPRFRFEEELLAHRAEWAKLKDGPPMMSATQQRKALAQLARRLSGPLYGNLKTPEQAAGLIIAQPNCLVKEVNLGDSP